MSDPAHVLILLTLIAPAIVLGAVALKAAAKEPKNDNAAYLGPGAGLPPDAPENVKETR
jgi:hypothetical protein